MYFWVQFQRSMFLTVQLTLRGISLAQAMAWQQTGDKPLHEPLMTTFSLLYGVTRPQWVNSWSPSEAKWQDICRATNTGSGNGLLPDGTKPLPESEFGNHKQGLLAFNWRQYSITGIIKIFILGINFKGGSPILDVQRAHAVSTYNKLWLWCLVVTC